MLIGYRAAGIAPGADEMDSLPDMVETRYRVDMSMMPAPTPATSP